MSMLNIGNKQSKKIVMDIVNILEAINKNETSNEVGIKALETYTDIAPIRNVNITDCNFSNIHEKDNAVKVTT